VCSETRQRIKAKRNAIQRELDLRKRDNRDENVQPHDTMEAVEEWVSNTSPVYSTADSPEMAALPRSGLGLILSDGSGSSAVRAGERSLSTSPAFLAEGQNKVYSPAERLTGRKAADAFDGVGSLAVFDGGKPSLHRSSSSDVSQAYTVCQEGRKHPELDQKKDFSTDHCIGFMANLSCTRAFSASNPGLLQTQGVGLVTRTESADLVNGNGGRVKEWMHGNFSSSVRDWIQYTDAANIYSGTNPAKYDTSKGYLRVLT
jgi:hypothetical protein